MCRELPNMYAHRGRQSAASRPTHVRGTRRGIFHAYSRPGYSVSHELGHWRYYSAVCLSDNELDHEQVAVCLSDQTQSSDIGD